MEIRQEQDTGGAPPHPRTPAWVRVFGIIAGLLFLFLLASMVIGGGGHGPARHGSSGGGGGHVGSARLLVLGALFLTVLALNWSWLADRRMVPALRGFSQVRMPSWQPMALRQRKMVLTAHVASSVGWLGAVLAYLALDITAVTGRNVPIVRAAYVAMDLVIWYAIVPLAIASLLIGLVNALGTRWGLIRHYWVLLKLLMTILATLVLLKEAQTVSDLANAAGSLADPRALPGTLPHSIGAVAVLLVVSVLAMFKPRGVTRYGWRMQQERTDAPA
jgi:hypothetical protein